LQLDVAHLLVEGGGFAGKSEGLGGTMTTTASDMITFWPKIGNYNEPGSDNGWVGFLGG